MNARAVLRLRLPSEETAAHVARALEPDNAGYVTQRVDGATVTAEAEAASTGSLLHTLDDYVACFVAAEKTARAASQDA